MSNDKIHVDHFVIYPTKTKGEEGETPRTCSLEAADAWIVLAITPEKAKVQVARVNDDMNLKDVVGRLLEVYDEAEHRLRAIWLEPDGSAKSMKTDRVDRVLAEISMIPTEGSALAEGRLAQLRHALDVEIPDNTGPGPA